MKVLAEAKIHRDQYLGTNNSLGQQCPGEVTASKSHNPDMTFSPIFPDQEQSPRLEGKSTSGKCDDAGGNDCVCEIIKEEQICSLIDP